MKEEIEIKKDVPKTGAEKKLSTKYKKLLKITNDFIGLQQLAIDFKADLAVFLQKNRRYSSVIVLLFFTSFSFAQSNIIAAGNQTETFGEVFPIMQTVDTIVQVSLGVPTFELPEPPKPKPIKKQSFIEKIIALFKSLFKK